MNINVPFFLSLQEKLKLETDLRAELCEEFNRLMVEIERGWEQRLKDQKNR